MIIILPRVLGKYQTCRVNTIIKMARLAIVLVYLIINKMFAIIMLIYHSFQIPIKYRYFTTLLSMITIFLMPSLSIVTYSATTFGVVMYHKMKKRSDKFIILIFYAVIMSWFYYDEIIKYHSKTTRTNNTKV